MTMEGGCACGAARYRLTGPPLIVHACHCRDCQRLTGAAFGVNLWIEEDRLEADMAGLSVFRTTGGSGKPHDVYFCPKCGTSLFSRYHAAPEGTIFVRVGTLDDPSAVAPDVHIFTQSKQPWLALPAGTPAFEAFYALKDVWPGESLDRLRALRR